MSVTAKQLSVRFDDAEVVAYLRGHGGSEVLYSKGQALLRRGDTGRAFFVILSGEVEIRLADTADRTMPLTRMGPGSSFGEMALLRGAPVSADVVALSDVTVLEYPGDRFEQALAECQALRDRLLMRLSDNLEQTTSEAWEFFQRAEALQALTRTEDHPSRMVATSAKLRAVEKKIRGAADRDVPVAIVGEPGTGKLLAARLVHGGEDTVVPMIVVDCRRLASHEARKLIFGTTRIGSVVDSSSGFGAVHLAHGGSLVLHHADSLDSDMQRDVVRLISDDDPPPFPRFRLIATCRSSDGQDEGGLISEIVRRGEAIQMPRLVECRRDIVPLARHFLEECTEGQNRDLTISARHAVVSLGYRHRNMAELRETIQLAALCADGDEIRAEHIFTAPGEATAPTGFNLGEVAVLRGVVRRRPLALARAGVLVGFAAVIALCLVLPFTAAGRAANTVIWNAWEPMVFGLFLIVGRVWCTVCPLSTVGRVAKGLGSLNRPPPSWLVSSWVWIATVGFLAIIWSERVFHMTSSPFPSGILLLTLIVLPIVFSLVFQREVWCRYVCPLGTLGAALTPPSPLHLEANASVCASTCTTHDCYKGSKAKKIPGCTVFHHPLDASEAYTCKLCMDCLSSCPHQSARVYLQAPLFGVWRLGTATRGLSLFSLTVFLLAPVVLAAQRGFGLNTDLGITLGSLAALAGGAVLSWLLPGLLHGSSEDDSPVPAQVSFALLLLGWGPLMAYQFGNISALSAFHLTTDPPSLLGRLVGASDITLLPIAQLFIIVLAATLAGITLWRIRVRATREGIAIAWGGWSVLLAGCLIYLGIVLALILGR